MEITDKYLGKAREILDELEKNGDLAGHVSILAGHLFKVSQPVELSEDEERLDIEMKWRLWDAGFCGEQSAERGPIMNAVRDLVREAELRGAKRAMELNAVAKVKQCEHSGATLDYDIEFKKAITE